MLASLIGRLIAVLLFKAGPQHVPYSWTLLAGMYAAYFLTSVLVIAPSLTLYWSVVEAAVDLAFMSLFTFYLLSVFNRRARFVQTATTLAGVSVLIQLVAWPLLMLMQGMDAATAVPTGAFITLVVLLAWQLAVFAHVFRYALEVSMLRSAALALLYLFLSMFIVGMVVPQQ